MDVLPIVDSWIVGGDLNNIESIADVRAITSPHLTSIAPVERDSWDGFLFSLRVSDAWHMPGFAHTPKSLDFSWGFRREGADYLSALTGFTWVPGPHPVVAL